jgi:hypothetical protein
MIKSKLQIPTFGRVRHSVRAVFVDFAARGGLRALPFTSATDPLSDFQFHSVIRDAHIDTSLSGNCVNLRGDLTFVAGHNFQIRNA